MNGNGRRDYRYELTNDGFQHGVIQHMTASLRTQR
jgi:hypothetical protein